MYVFLQLLRYLNLRKKDSISSNFLHFNISNLKITKQIQSVCLALLLFGRPALKLYKNMPAHVTLKQNVYPPTENLTFKHFVHVLVL